MLANNAKLGYKASSSASTYTDLAGLKEIPDIGVEPEKVENTCLTDGSKKYENGIGDPGDMTFKFKYENTANSAYRVLRSAIVDTSGNPVTLPWELSFADGTKFHFDAQASIKVNGGGVNAAIEFELSLSLQSDITVVDPV